MPNPTATGSFVHRRMRATSAASIGGHALLRAGNADARDGVYKTFGVLRDGFEARIGTGGRGKKDRRQIHAVHFGEVFGSFFHDHVDGKHAVRTGSLGIVSKFRQAVAKNRIQDN